MKAINKKIVITILVILEICSMYLMYKSYNNKNILDSKIETKEKMAIKVIDDNGEYESKSKLPGREYVLNDKLTECYNQEGKKVENLKLTSNGENITITSSKTLYCTLYFDLPESREYDYTGDYQVFMAPKTGNYKIELWGASGGTTETGAEGGKGAYTKGIIYLEKGEKLYVYVGESGHTYTLKIVYVLMETFNGGGSGAQHEYTNASSGGGATDVRLEISGVRNWNDFNSLKSRIMVAAGGGGGMWWANVENMNGGYGGTFKGAEGEMKYTGEPETRVLENTTGGTQISGGETNDRKTLTSYGKFGKGGDNCYISSGGGSGYYGGAGGIDQGASPSAGAGGSSFISGHTGCVAIKESSTEENVQIKDGCSDGTEDINCSYHYSNKVFTETEMKAGNETMPTHDGSNTMIGNTGNGYAKITFVG